MNQNVRLEVHDNIGELTFDRVGSSANVFDQSTFDELNAVLDQLERMGSLKGLLFRSAKPKVFLAGADLHGLVEKQTAAHFAFLVEQGQKTFDRIAGIPFPTIALIHGVALGGGLEMALACDYRIASVDSTTKIGFPEISIGLIPAWGGSTRLPRLIGLPKALEIILSARQYPARQALRLGLVDELGPVERLQQMAYRLVQNSSGRKRMMKVHPVNSALLRKFIKDQARRKALAGTRGNYPAPLKAIDVVCASLSLSHQESLSREKNEVIALGMGEAAKNLLRIFFLQERAKKPVLSAISANKKHVLVIGAGLMGAGIAQWLSTRGLRVTLRDVGPVPLAAGMQAVSRLFQDGIKRGIFTETEAAESLDRIVPISSDIPLNDIDLVIEAATESLDTKRKIFTQLESQVAPETVLATNTSAICLEELGKTLKFPDRLAGIHFFNPVHRMQLVEVVYSPATTPSTLQSCLSLVKAIGKLPVVVKDSPGFLVNRILMPYLMEAIRLFNEGYRPREIDDVMLDFGMAMGPLRLLDEVGLDVAQHVALELSGKISHL
ncbi:MAG: enoyl-CoA hydratase/isomerase family protein, partial [Verrucomicrobia bacterium]|nr:enoyl-CoA hydratase/isomerase family protein [Verrucomicrobiota bacterium]